MAAREKTMRRRRSVIFGGILLAAATAMDGSPGAFAQQTSFQNYRCADGSEFIAGFFGYDRRAHLQIDGKSVTLAKRLALSGSRYSGGGITLRITRSGATLKRARRPATTCQMT
jgi:membrane-bound inhibitor of C-type lysozyme